MLVGFLNSADERFSLETLEFLQLKALHFKAGKSQLAFLKPFAESKYYTKEVEKRLDKLLAKDSEELTLADVQELNRIGDLMWLEGYERNDEFLREYGIKLYTTLVKVLFIYLKIAKLKEGY
jgi:hypothetical protein